MIKQQYKENAKITNQSNVTQKQDENQSVTQEQISDTVAEGTIDVKLEQQSIEEQ
ncbi:DUF4025 domain-containing protein [Bacillus sp. DX1.1]|uniref:DUF4025 domain-containing protein n=1 Tax=unclassified Bacillus (in: firmicutes) TaxID=185979 RepID=UPI002570DE3A|nr:MULTISPECIES: DUF4025 domain-containing protein [unclassified Bacillus (in: firmicutes)]MDM5154037.1 DUF4025 domain-containing protein [Bacillus sp. DX1.1]WJE82967.1 DUF4025 domain-containing protein [Bacillus sp. DX3.1]